MKNIKVYFSFFLLATVAFSILVMEGRAETSNLEKQEKILMRIYFVPFMTETFVPLPMEEIEKRNLYEIWFMREHPSTRLVKHPFVDKLRRILRSKLTKSRIDNSFIRLKVVMNEEIYFVDIKGVVWDKKNDKSFQLSRKQRMEIEKEIINFSGVIDARTSKEIGILKED